MLALWVLLSICHFTDVTGFTSTEWRGKIIHQYYYWTKAFRDQDLDALMNIYSDGYAGVKLGQLLGSKQELREEMPKYIKDYRFLYVGFVDMLFNTDAIAFATYMGFGETPEGREVHFQGVQMFVKEGNEIKVNISSYR